jgi:hypothetical protein
MTTARGLPRQGPTGGLAPDGAEDTRPVAAPAEDVRPPLDLMKFITSIGSPIALATALLFYFGWVRSEEQARAFGADASVFAMSTQDYVLRSVNVLFFPLILMFLVVLLLLRLDRRLRAGPDAPPWLDTAGRLLQLSWLVFLPLGFVLYAVAGRSGDVTLPLWVALSVVAPAYGTVLRRRATGERGGSRVTVGILVALVTVILFWQTERLASLGGEALAQDVKDNLGDRLTRVDLFSVTNLHLDGPGVTTERIGGAVEGEYGYRYSGLYLLQRSGDKYFLLTDGWDEDRGRLVVIPDDPGIRVEFGP